MLLFVESLLSTFILFCSFHRITGTPPKILKPFEDYFNDSELYLNMFPFFFHFFVFDFVADVLTDVIPQVLPVR